MTDTAERLRLYARQFEDLHAPQNVTIGMREAAAEIERLRAEGDKARARGDKMRMALEDIAYPNPLHNEDDLMRIARAALEGPQDRMAKPLEGK